MVLRSALDSVSCCDQIKLDLHLLRPYSPGIISTDIIITRNVLEFKFPAVPHCLVNSSASLSTPYSSGIISTDIILTMNLI